MAYFPFFVDIEGMNILIIGGGTVALRKAEKLLPYGGAITVAALELCDELRALPGVRLVREPFNDSMLEGADIVIAATNDRKLNRHIYDACRGRKIPVNSVDCKSECTFIFPSLVKRGVLSVGISTSGASPSAAIWLKERINALLPDNMEELIEYLDRLRPYVKERLCTEAERAKVFKAAFSKCMSEGRVLTEHELNAIISEVREHE